MSEEAGGAVRFAGKVDVWFYLITIAANILLIVPAAMAFADPAKEGALLGAAISLGCLVVCDALFIPMIARNYVEFDDEGNFVVAFGWQGVRVPVEKVRALRETRSPPRIDRRLVRPHRHPAGARGDHDRRQGQGGVLPRGGAALPARNRRAPHEVAAGATACD